MALSDDKLWDLWNAQGTDDMSRIEAFTFARAIEAEVRKGDEALIRQMLEALEGSIAITMVKIDMRNAALTSGRAWLEGKP